MTTDLVELDAAAPDPWEAGAEDEEEEFHRCGCADCRALRGRGAERERAGGSDA